MLWVCVLDVSRVTFYVPYLLFVLPQLNMIKLASLLYVYCSEVSVCNVHFSDLILMSMMMQMVAMV